MRILPIVYDGDITHRLYDNDKMTGYIEDHFKLFGIGHNGYAEFIGEIEHTNQTIPMLKRWLQSRDKT